METPNGAVVNLVGGSYVLCPGSTRREIHALLEDAAGGLTFAELQTGPQDTDTVSVNPDHVVTIQNVIITTDEPGPEPGEEAPTT